MCNVIFGVSLADGSYWRYRYDSLGQVTSGKKYWTDQIPVAGQQFEYAYDDIGNRTQTRSGGDENGANLRTATYGANLLNQYTNRDIPGYIDIIGVGIASNAVTVNGQTTYRKGEFFRRELPMTNSAVALWTNITASETGQSSVTGNVFLTKTPEIFGFDADGNLTNDGRWALTWDGENRLVQVESLPSTPSGSKRKVMWRFDGKGRRIRESAYDGSSGSYLATKDLVFLNDGLHQIAELNATNNTLVRSYVWGLDVSGNMAYAGGVGGLLMLNSAANGGQFYAYDGLGNVVTLFKASDGFPSANYEYDPFGVVLRATGSIVGENRFQFSTKRREQETSLELYEHRVRRADLAWLSRDPIEEAGGQNLYCFALNSPCNRIDPDGKSSVGTIWSPPCSPQFRILSEL